MEVILTLGILLGCGILVSRYFSSGPDWRAKVKTNLPAGEAERVFYLLEPRDHWFYQNAEDVVPLLGYLLGKGGVLYRDVRNLYQSLELEEDPWLEERFLQEYTSGYWVYSTEKGEKP